MKIKCNSREEYNEHIWQLKRYGYNRVSDCYWFETWEKANGWTVEIEINF